MSKAINDEFFKKQLGDVVNPWPRPANRSRLSHAHSNRTNKYARLQSQRFSRQEAKERKLHLLPALASTVLFDCERKSPGTWSDPVLRSILMGTRDDNSSLRVLRNFESTIVRSLYSYIVPEWSNHITLTIPAQCIGKIYDPKSRGLRNKILVRYSDGRPTSDDRTRYYDIIRDTPQDRGFVAFAKCGNVTFPPPKDRNVNMMPFVIGEETSLPDELKCYQPLIEMCPYDDEEIGKIGYLTVHESFVEKDGSQRRKGLHIEAPGSIINKSAVGDDAAKFSPSFEHGWGRGHFLGHDRFMGGMYIASTISNTSEVWDALVHNAEGVTDDHGGCEHIRSLIGHGTKLQANELVWMTDRTPHEALVQESSGYRQFFRFVTSEVSHWYEAHCTPNPKVPLPLNVIVVKGNKFTKYS